MMVQEELVSNCKTHGLTGYVVIAPGQSINITYKNFAYHMGEFALQIQIYTDVLPYSSLPHFNWKKDPCVSRLASHQVAKLA